MRDKISVALATFNGSKYIKEQLFSIINQTLSVDEIIIVDDNSTDDTFEILKEIQQNNSSIVLYRNEKNIGPIQTFKKAIEYCSYEYVALSDQDDVWEKNKIEICFNQLKQMNEYKPSIVFTDLEMVDSYGNSLGETFWKVQKYDVGKTKFRHLLVGNIVTGCTILMNKKMKDEIIKMPDNVIMHDHWIALIVFSIGDFKALEQTTMKFRIHQNNVTTKSKMSLYSRIRYFLEVFFDKENLYMSENIRQAELFLQVYGSELNVENYKELKKFVELKRMNSFLKKMHVANIKYLKN